MFEPEPHKHLKGATYVYVLECMGRSKIGIAQDTFARAAALQLACPFPVALKIERLFDTRREARLIERDLHAKFSEHRLWGEWFNIEPQDVADALAVHPGSAKPVSFKQPERPAELLPAKRPSRAKPIEPTAVETPSPRHATWDELEAMSDDEWASHMGAVMERVFEGVFDDV